MVTPYEGYVEVCEELARRTPGTHDKRSALFNSGAEAVENAVKIARHATGRQAVVAFDHAYHGRTNLTMALTAKNMPYKDKFGPFAGEIYRMPMAYPLRWPGGREACAAEALAMVKDAERLGFAIMAGCMVATSLAIAPALLVAQHARVVDLDGALLLARDRPDGLHYEGSLVHPPTPALWGL